MKSESRYICGVRVDAVSYAEIAARVVDWANRGESRMLCFSSVHMIMEARESTEFRNILNGADIVTPDGMPLVWGLRLLGVRNATRVYGPDSTDFVAAAAERADVPIALYGGTPDSLAKLIAVFQQKYPKLRIVWSLAPPFRPLTPEEKESHLAGIRESGARIVMIGLGCPKQEQWMAANRGSLPAVMLGVGAAFDFLAGVKRQAPRWMMRMGLEWFFRLVTEPKRLWVRYLKQNPWFVPLFLMQLWRTRMGTVGAAGPVARS